MKMKNILIIGLMIILMINVVSALTINGTTDKDIYDSGETITYSCDLDSGLDNITEINIYRGLNGDSLELLDYKYDGDKQEVSVGDTFSVNYLDYGTNLSDPTDNPTIVYTTGETSGTCELDNNIGCNMLSTLSGNAPGGYWFEPYTPRDLIFKLNDTYYVEDVKVASHSTFYPTNISIYYSYDGETYYLSLTEAATAITTKTVNHTARYIKIRANSYNNVQNWYGIYTNITGKNLAYAPINDTIEFDETVNFGGGLYDWLCNIKTDDTYYNSTTRNITIDSAKIDYSEDTPADTTESTFFTLGTEVTNTDKNVYTFLDINDTLLDWWTFDNENNVFENKIRDNDFDEPVEYIVVNTSFGQGVETVDNRPLYADIDVGKDFTIIVTVNQSYDGTSIINRDWFGAKGTNIGWITRWSYNNATNGTALNFLMYNGTGYVGATGINFAGITDFAEENTYGLSLDYTNNKFYWFVNGVMELQQNISMAKPYFETYSRVAFKSFNNMNSTFDDILIINRTVTIDEGEALTRKGTTYDVEYDFSELDEDFSFSVNPISYTSDGIYSYAPTRTYTSLVAPTITYTNYYPTTNIESGDTISLYCDATLNNSQVSPQIEYSYDNQTWVSTTETLLTNTDTYAVAGDSMSNVYSDWTTWLGTPMGLNESYFNMASWDGSGKSCQYVLDTELPRITNGTDYVFLTCGVNNFATTNHSDIWTQLYDELKAKDVENVYMTTMPPWRYINTLNDTEATSFCNKQKDANTWLKNFATQHDDLYVSDLWTTFHDTTGTNKTDCGWDETAGITNDGVHPNSVGNRIWGEAYWDMLDQIKYGVYATSYTAEDVETDTEVYFKCYSDHDDRLSLSTYFGTISLEGNAPAYTEGINSVKTIAYSAFALLAVMILAGLAILTYSIINKDMNADALIQGAIIAIGSAIVLFVGYIIISAVANGLI